MHLVWNLNFNISSPKNNIIMKKIYFILVLISMFATSCSDFFDTAPSNKIPTTIAFRTITDVDNAVNGLYDLMSSSGYYGAAMFAYGDMKGDDMQSSEESGVCNTCYMFNHRPNSLNAGSLWGRPFYILREAWNILNAISEGKIQGEDQDKLNALKGEAMAMIALCQFDLTRCFGYPYTKDNGASLGAPLIDHLIGTYEYPPRATVAQAYDYIIDTLEEAVTLMSDEKNNGRMNAFAARALLARIYLYHNDNQKAFDTAIQLIKDATSSGGYALYTHETYISAWSINEKFNSESFFEIANNVDDTPGRDSWGYLLNWYGYQKALVTQKFADQLLSDPNDVRGQLLKENKYAGNTVWWLYKWRGADIKTAPLESNYVILRLSETYLIAAEAGYKLGGNAATQGLIYLNEIVKRGNPNNEVSMLNYTLDRVLDERSKELIGEGHRYFDLLRNGKTIIRKGGYHLPSVDEEVNWNFYKCVLPIPEDQFIFSPEMEQNPGYPKN